MDDDNPAPVVRDILKKLATELNELGITQDLQLMPPTKDFDDGSSRSSILDRSDRRIVAAAE